MALRDSEGNFHIERHIISVECRVHFFLKVHVVHIIAFIAMSPANSCSHSLTYCCIKMKPFSEENPGAGC